MTAVVRILESLSSVRYVISNGSETASDALVYAERALAGLSGVQVINDHRGVPVFSVHAPLVCDETS